MLTAAETVARALLRRFAPGEKVAVWSPISAEWVLLQHGVSLAGMVLVTVNPAYLAGELEHVLKASQAAGIFFTDVYRNTNMAVTVEEVRTRLPRMRETISFSDWSAFLSTSDPTLPLPFVKSTDMVQIQFTSGTTGRPKRRMPASSRDHQCRALRGDASRFFPDGGAWLSAMPLFHVGGCAGSELGAFSARGTFVMQPAFNAGVMLELLESERVAHLHAVPTMLVALLDHPEFPEHDYSELRTVMSGGSQVPAELVARVKAAFGCKFTINFGQTELNGVISQTFPDDSPQLQATTVGQPTAKMDVKIADPETGAVRPLGKPGEVWARGYQTMLGYFNSPEDTGATVTSDGWLKTGDLATLDAFGYLRVVGRLKDSIIRGGENIYPREIEDVLDAHPSILSSCVVGVPDEKWGEIVAAAIQFRNGATRPAAGDLHAYCRSRLAAYKTPALWFYVDAFPSTGSGKVQKYRLREQIRSGELAPEPFTRPPTRAVEP